MNTPPQPDVQPEMSRKAAEPSPPQPEVRPGVTKNDRAKRPRLSQLLLGDSGPKTIKDTELKHLKITTSDLASRAISRKVFLKGQNLSKNGDQYFSNSPEFEPNGVQWEIVSERNLTIYEVLCQWSSLPPRTDRPWFKRLTFSCSCPGFDHHGPALFCKHIVYVILRRFI